MGKAKEFLDMLEENKPVEEEMIVNHAFVVKHKDETIHMGGYTEKPNDEDKTKFMEELKTDEDLKIPAEVLEECTVEMVSLEEPLVLSAFLEKYALDGDHVES